MDNFKEMVVTGWSARRVFGAVLTTFVVVQAVMLKDSLLGLLGAYFFYQVITNTGCFGSDGCAVPVQESTDVKIPTKKLKL